MAENPFERVGREFKRAAEKNALRFRRKLQRAKKQTRAAPDPGAAAERSRIQVKLAIAEFEAAMAGASAEFKANLERAREELSEMRPEEAKRALEELKQARQELRARKATAPRGARGWRQIRPAQEEVERLTERLLKKPPKRPPPPRRGLEGGEPVPVEPRPKPKPLIDGAEAPIE